MLEWRRAGRAATAVRASPSGFLANARLSYRGPCQAHAANLGQPGFGLPENESCEVFQRRRSDAIDLVEQLMVEDPANGLERRVHLAKIAHPAFGGVGLALERHFRIKAMPVQ